MDILTVLRELGDYISHSETMWEQAKPYARTLEKNRDYYLKLIATQKENEDSYKLEIQKVPCVKERIAEEIFYVKLPTGGNPYICSATVKQLMKPTGGNSDVKIENYAFYQLGSMLPEGHYLKKPLLGLAKAWYEGRVEYESEFDLESLTEHLKSLEYRDPINAPMTLILNGKKVMDDEDCQIAWYARYTGSDKLQSEGECVYCNTNENLLTQGSSKWKCFTVTRKTQLSGTLPHIRCNKCEKKIVDAEHLLELQQVIVDKDTYQFCIAVTKEAEKAAPIIKKWTERWGQEGRNEKLNKALMLRDTLVEMDSWDIISQLVYITATIERQKTFELKELQVIPVNKFRIQQALDAKANVRYFLEEHNIYFPSYKRTLLLKPKMKEYCRENTKDILINLNYGQTPFHFQYLSKTLRAREKEIEKVTEKKAEGLLIGYELMYLHLKGVDIVSLKETKEYAIGVLLNIAESAQYRKYNQGKNTNHQPPIAKKFVNVKPKDFIKIHNEAQRVINTCSKFINKYEWNMVRYATEKMNMADMDTKNIQERLIPFYMGYRAREFYPEIQMRPTDTDKKDTSTPEDSSVEQPEVIDESNQNVIEEEYF